MMQLTVFETPLSTVFATPKMAPQADVITSQDASVERKVVLTGAVGVVSGTAIASITGAEWSNPN